MRRGGCLVVVVGAVLAPASADAAVVSRGLAPAAGPQLAGPEVVWGERLGRRGQLLVRAATPDGPGRVLYRRPAPRNRLNSRDFDGSEGALVASATRLAFIPLFSRILHRDGDLVGLVSVSQLLAGPLGGPFARLSGRAMIPRGGRCRPGETEPEGAALAGDTLVYAEAVFRCRGRDPASRVVVRDLSAGRVLATLPVTRRDLAVNQVRVAGSLVAWAELTADGGVPSGIVVHDLAAGRQLYRVRAPGSTDVFGDFDLLADGRVVAAYTAGSRRRLAWWSPGEPGAHPISRRASQVGVVADGDRILFEEVRGVHRSELVVKPLTGGARTVLDGFSRNRKRTGDVDFQGGRAVWAWGSPPESGRGGVGVAEVP